MRQAVCFLCYLSVLAGLMRGSLALANHRVALVIGNSSYSGNAALPTVKQDAESVAEGLRARHFRVTTAIDRTRDQQRQLIDDFIDSAPINGTALIYFGGHSMTMRDNQDTLQTLLLTTEGNRKAIVLEEVIELASKSAAESTAILVDSGKGIAPGYDPRRGPAGFRSIDKLPGDLWLGFAVSPGMWSTQAGLIANRLSESKTEDLESELKSVACWRLSTCETGAISQPASIAITPPDTIVRGTKAGDEWVSCDGTVFCWCPASDNLRGFWMSKYETPQSKQPIRLDRGAIGNHRNDPVNGLRRRDLASHIAELTALQRKQGYLSANWQYSLPSPEQWEYAALAGSDPKHFELPESQIPEHANFADRSLLETGDDLYEYADPDLSDGYAELAPVGSFLPNHWGLHDLFGNVWEQTTDGNLRGGSWVSPKQYLNVHLTKSAPADSNNYPANFFGYRLVIQEVR